MNSTTQCQLDILRGEQEKALKSIKLDQTLSDKEKEELIKKYGLTQVKWDS